jgi:formiminotetrahydrofolate cyclodeaminase
MVARLTIGRKKYVEVQEQMQAILDRSETLRAELTQAIENDACAFDEVMRAIKLPRDNEEQAALRQKTLESAYLQAAKVPLEVAEKAVEVMKLVLQVVTLGNYNAISDGATAAALAMAALTGAGYNVRINLKGQESSLVQEMFLKLDSLEKSAKDLDTRIRAQFQQRGDLVAL